jgi:ABC-type transport system involved in cytochrome c biogenesis permease subunit
MTWQQYIYFLIPTIGFWLISLIFLSIFKSKTLKLAGKVSMFLGVLCILVFTIGLWINLQRPVFRTLAETRLWYGIFISIIGIVIYLRWSFLWVAFYNFGLASLFLVINYFNPDTFDKSLMPALQSPWFIPHVIVYMIGYAFLGVSSLLGVIGLFKIWKKKGLDNILKLADNIVYIGFAFLTFGLLFGALWAKEAWGHYWTWDPKETWAFITWLMYLLYIHLRYHAKKNINWSFWALALAFVVLMICWFGVNYLPSAQNSVHVY